MIIARALLLVNLAALALHKPFYELDGEEPCDGPSARLGTRLRTTLRHPLPGETWRTRFVRLSQGLGRGRVEAKLRRLLADFEWGAVGEWMTDWNRTRTNTERARMTNGQWQMTKS